MTVRRAATAASLGLVLALGAETSYFNIPGAKEHSYPLKTFADAVKLRDRIQDVIEANEAVARIVVVGGGASGVEVAAEFENFIRVLHKKDHAPSACKIEVTLAEAGPEILAGFDKWVIDCARQRLGCLNVAIKTNGGILVGHNEDWLSSYRHNGMFVLKAKLNGQHSLSLNYIGSLAGSSSGLNSSGLCFSANSLNPGRFRYGVPIKFQFRAMLDCKTPRQAIYSDLAESSISGSDAASDQAAASGFGVKLEGALFDATGDFLWLFTVLAALAATAAAIGFLLPGEPRRQPAPPVSVAAE